jgi:hypothetical protein
MAKARMLHKKICTSEDVNKLPLPARLLFSWLITAADDDGRMKGDPPYVKVEVVPYTNWPLKLISTYLNQMKDIGLIYYWQQDSRWYIEFSKWKEHQYIAKDRYHPSLLPSYEEFNKSLYTTRIQPVYKPDTQSNISKSNEIKVNKSEYKENVADKDINDLASPTPTNTNKNQQIDDLPENPTKTYRNLQIEEPRQIPTSPDELQKVTNRDNKGQINKYQQKTTKTNYNEQKRINLELYKGNEYPKDPNQYRLTNAREVAAKAAWQMLENDNPIAFYTTYLSAANKGLPPSLFYQFASEIKQSNAIKRGAVFNSKVKSYFEKKGNTE